jgi:CheY-like chemotaxis protein
MLEYWGCKVTRPGTDSVITSETTDITITCLNRNNISRLKAGENIHNKPVSKQPHLAIISSNRPEDIEYARNTGVDAVLVFTSPQKQIYHTLCTLINSTEIPNKVIASDSSAPSPDFSGIHVLVVDDNAINRRLAEIILQQHGAHVVTASSGNAAIQLAEKHAFNIIFMDLHMPGLDGYATTERIRLIETSSEPIIIALTANAMPAERTRVYESGMNDIMIKPINEELMNNVVSKWLDQTPDVSPENPQGEIASVIFSLEEAEKFTGGNIALALELTNMLKIELPEYQTNIAVALESGDYAELKSHVHKLHGATRCCGTPALREAAKHMEHLVDQKQYDRLVTAARRLNHEIIRLLDYPVDVH